MFIKCSITFYFFNYCFYEQFHSQNEFQDGVLGGLGAIAPDHAVLVLVFAHVNVITPGLHMVEHHALEKRKSLNFVTLKIVMLEKISELNNVDIFLKVRYSTNVF